jgi:hypothetical protein
MRLDPIDATPCVEQFVGDLLADNSGKRHRETKTMVKAKPRKVRRKPRLGGRNAEVRRERKTETATHSCALHGGNDR